MFWSTRRAKGQAQSAFQPADSGRTDKPGRNQDPDFLISLEQLMIANMLWMAR
jgi:hypothetical protein